jgi:hypothetical protein
MTRTVPSDRDVRTRSTAFRVDLGTRYVTVWCLACCRKEWGEALYDKAHGARIVGGWGGVGKQWTEKESFQQYFYNRYKILHTCHTYYCYTYHFYMYWLYFIYVWHVYVSPKTYKWFGTFIIKDGRYTFTFILCNTSHLSMGRDSAVSITTCYRLDSLGIKSWWGWCFPNLSRPALRPTQSPLWCVLGHSQG